MRKNPRETPAWEDCRICSQLRESETASQKYGWEENDSALPGAVNELVTQLVLKPNSDRKLDVLQCPLCKTYYLYQSDYEYLVNGSEDEQSLTRLSPEQAEKFFLAHRHRCQSLDVEIEP